MRQAKAALDEARLRYERAKTLIKNGDISQERFDEAEIQHRSAEARYQAAQDSFHNQTASVEQRAAELQLARKELQDTIYRGSSSTALSAPGTSHAVNTSRLRRVSLPWSSPTPCGCRPSFPRWRLLPFGSNQPVTLSVDAYPGKTFSGIHQPYQPLAG